MLTFKKILSAWKALPDEKRRDLTLLAVSVSLLLAAAAALIGYMGGLANIR